MPRIALNWTQADFNKRHEVSPDLSRQLHHHFWRKIRKIKVIKCPPNSALQRSQKSNPKTNLKEEKPTRTLTVKLRTMVYT